MNAISVLSKIIHIRIRMRWFNAIEKNYRITLHYYCALWWCLLIGGKRFSCCAFSLMRRTMAPKIPKVASLTKLQQKKYVNYAYKFIHWSRLSKQWRHLPRKAFIVLTVLCIPFSIWTSVYGIQHSYSCVFRMFLVVDYRNYFAKVFCLRTFVMS